MFGLSLGKLLVLALLVVAVWYGWKYVGRVNAVREAIRRGAQPQRRPDPSSLKAEDMTKCRTCGAYVAGGAASCGRPDCPF